MKNSDLKIDESSLREAPGFFKRLLNALYSLILAFVLAQVFVLIFSLGNPLLVRSIIPWLGNPLFLAYLGACTVIGFIAGDRFIGLLKNKIVEWNLRARCFGTGYCSCGQAASRYQPKRMVAFYRSHPYCGNHYFDCFPRTGQSGR